MVFRVNCCEEFTCAYFYRSLNYLKGKHGIQRVILSVHVSVERAKHVCWLPLAVLPSMTRRCAWWRHTYPETETQLWEFPENPRKCRRFRSVRVIYGRDSQQTLRIASSPVTLSGMWFLFKLVISIFEGEHGSFSSLPLFLFLVTLIQLDSFTFFVLFRFVILHVYFETVIRFSMKLCKFR